MGKDPHGKYHRMLEVEQCKLDKQLRSSSVPLFVLFAQSMGEKLALLRSPCHDTLLYYRTKIHRTKWLTVWLGSSTVNQDKPFLFIASSPSCFTRQKSPYHTTLPSILLLHHFCPLVAHLLPNGSRLTFLSFASQWGLTTKGAILFVFKMHHTSHKHPHSPAEFKTGLCKCKVWNTSELTAQRFISLCCLSALVPGILKQELNFPSSLSLECGHRLEHDRYLLKEWGHPALMPFASGSDCIVEGMSWDPDPLSSSLINSLGDTRRRLCVVTAGFMFMQNPLTNVSLIAT